MRVSSGVEANVFDQPIVRIEQSLLIEVVSGFIPEKLPGLGRGVVQQLRVGLHYRLVQSSVLYEQRSGLRQPNESNRLNGYHFVKPGVACCTGHERHEG